MALKANPETEMKLFMSSEGLLLLFAKNIKTWLLSHNAMVDMDIY